MESSNPMLPEVVAGTEIDWKMQMTAEYRRMIVTKICGSMMKKLSCGPRDAPRFESLASKFEDKIFSTATSKDDYWWKINVKMRKVIESRAQQSLPRSSAPDPAYSVESSIPQASPLHRYHGNGRPLEMQPELQKHPSSVVKDPLSHETPAIHHQGTPKLNQLKVRLQQQQKPNDTNSQLNGQQKAVLDSPYSLYNHSDRNMHQLGPQVNASTFSGQPSTIDMLNDRGSILKVRQPELQLQAQQAMLPTLGLQPGKEQPNLQAMSTMHLQAQANNVQVMTEGTSQIIHSVGDDWEEQLYNEITNLKNFFLPALVEKYRESVKMLKKMDPNSQQQRTADYERLQRQLIMCRKVYVFLNFTKDKMSEEIRRWLPQCEKNLYYLLQDRSQGHISSSQEKQLPTSDDSQSLKRPIQLQYQKEQKMVTAEGEDRQLQKFRRTENFAQHKEYGVLQHHQLSVNLEALHSSQINRTKNEKLMQTKRAERGNFLGNDLSNYQLVKSKPGSIPYNSSIGIDMNNLEKPSRNIGHRSPSPLSVNSLTFSVPSLLKEDQRIGHCANTGDIKLQVTCGAQGSGGSLIVSVAKTLPSGLLAENANTSGKQCHNLGTDLSESIVPEEPIQRLINAAKSISHNAFGACVSDMESVLRKVDMSAGQVADNGSKFAVGEDLAAATTCRYGLKRDVGSQTMQRNLYATSIIGCFSESDNLNHVTDPVSSPLESSIAIHDKKRIFEKNCYLLEEIREINLQLIETVVEISQEEFMSSTPVSMTESGEEIVVKCAYTPAAIDSKMKLELASFLVSSIMPLKLLIPINYPACSPEILDKFPSEISMDCEDLSTKAKSKLILNLGILHQPLSLTDIARTWDTCARTVISEFAQNLGGGNFSSTYGSWKIYPSAA